MDRYKYQKLKKDLLFRIQAGGYGENGKIESEPALQRMTGLSRNTIRQAVKELELEGYLYRVRGSGTYVKNKIPGISKKIALLIYDTAYMTNHITSNMIRGVDHVLCRDGYTLDILAGHRDFPKESVAHLSESYAGFLVGAYQLDPLILQGLIKSGKPFLFVKNYQDHYKDLALMIDYEKAGYLAAEHLIRNGCRDLGLVYAGDSVMISRDFALGVKLAALEFGVRLKKSNCCYCPYSAPEEAGQYAAHFIKSKVDGVVCATDESAVVLCREFLKDGKSIPGEIQITGCNNNPVCSVISLPPTTLEIPAYDLGAAAAEYLLKRLHGIITPLPGKFLPELIRRKTTKWKCK